MEPFPEWSEDDAQPLDEQESALIRRDLGDLESFERSFAVEGFKGVSLYCHDCSEEHYYPWDMLRNNLTVLLETGETPVHEPAFAPDPDDYVPWDYARGYVDALSDVGAHDRELIEACPRCRYRVPEDAQDANFCPRCGTGLFLQRLRQALLDAGLEGDAAISVLRQAGLPHR